MPAVVHLEHCPTYDLGTLKQRAWAALNAVAFGLQINSGDRVLLKPNLINAQPPENAVCTHPALVRVVAEWVLEHGASVVVADQPGYALTDDVSACFRATRMIEACEGLPVEFRLLAKGGYVTVRPPRYHQLAEVMIARDALDASAIINLPKAKTHSQTLYTGAIKNMFGAVAPNQRLDVHLLKGYTALCGALADCYASRVPELSLLDSVLGMEGMGPTRGTPVSLGFLAASRDGVALDAVVAELMGFGPGEVATTAAAAALGVGEDRLSAIEVQGAAPAELRRPVRRSPVVRADLLGPLRPLLGWLVKARPSVRAEACRACGACAGICPAKAITMGDVAEVNDGLCLECFCCLEACPYDAIAVRRSPLYQAALRAKNWYDHCLVGRNQRG